ncbi:MAG: translation initiation factor IF-2 associated domain-containing protein, partial [Rhodomicrobium sp.]
MSETKETDHKTAGGRRTMSLNVKRTVEQGHIRQNFSHGRSKSVLVETKRKRSVSPGTGHEEPQEQPAAKKPEPRAFQKPSPDHAGDKRPQKVLRQLSAGEMDARARALLEARKREDVEKREREIEEARLREEAQKRAIEDQKRRAEEEAVRKVEEEVERLRAAEIAKANESAKAKEEVAAPRIPIRRPEPIRRTGPDVRIVRPQPDERRPVARKGESGPRAPAKDGAREGSRGP